VPVQWNLSVNMRLKNALVFISAIVILFRCNGQSNCDLSGGRWLIKKGALTLKYQRTGYSYSHDHVTFYKDKIKLASGFFYNILSLDSSDWALGRYPFIYYGNLEDYKISADSLYLYSKPYKHWNSFKINCINNNEVKLIASSDTILLERNNRQEAGSKCSIKFIRVHVYEQGLGLYDINYDVTYSKDDKLIFQQLSNKEPNLRSKTFKLEAGTFSEICKGFSRFDFTKLKNVYPSKESEVEIKEMIIELQDGRLIKSHLENDDYPEELRLALIPVLYGHQKYVYGHLPAVE
jgi:hypothetical protein